MIGEEGKRPKTSITGGLESDFVRLSCQELATFRKVVGCHDLAYPSLRGMSEVFDALPCRFQSVPEWIVPGPARDRNASGMDVVLFLRLPA
jgi:hypothetical protein